MIKGGQREPFGILTASRSAEIFGGNVANFKRIIKAANKQGISCSIYNVCPQGMTVYTGSSTEKLVRTDDRELPKVLYNRIPTRELENKSYVRDMLNQWEQQGHVITNPHFLRKDHLSQIWHSHPELVSYVPESRIVENATDILQFAEHTSTFYVKPIAGKAGVGILHVALQDQHYEVVEQQKGKRVSYGTLTQRQFEQWVNHRKWKCRYLLQEEAPVKLYHGRRFDLRLLLHKDSLKKFDITGMGVRVGSVSGITTHVPNGGVIAKPQKVLYSVFGSRAKRVEQTARLVAIDAAEAISNFSKTWTELSIDMGLLQDGTPVLFEANAKPMKFDELAIETAAKDRLVQCLLHLGSDR